LFLVCGKTKNVD